MGSTGTVDQHQDRRRTKAARKCSGIGGAGRVASPNVRTKSFQPESNWRRARRAANGELLVERIVFTSLPPRSGEHRLQKRAMRLASGQATLIHGASSGPATGANRRFRSIG